MSSCLTHGAPVHFSLINRAIPADFAEIALLITGLGGGTS